jgi:hypothetical protein
MNKTKTTLVSLALLSLAANFAAAREKETEYRCHGDHCTSAPEIDPGQALGALTLLTGTLAIVRGYRRKK